MNRSVLYSLNQVAEIYGRSPLSTEAAELYRKATGIADDEQFLKRLAELLKTNKSFPVPADFADSGKVINSLIELRQQIEPRIVHAMCVLKPEQVEEAIHLLFEYVDHRAKFPC